MADNQAHSNSLPRLAEALRHFANFRDKTQSQQHIKPLHYDERFVVGAPALAARTRRRVWASDSAVIRDGALAALDYPIRVES